MDFKDINEVKRLARAVITAADAAMARARDDREEHNAWYVSMGRDQLGLATRTDTSAESGTLRRRSMDLTRALSKMRNNR